VNRGEGCNIMIWNIVIVSYLYLGNVLNLYSIVALSKRDML